MQKKFQLEYVIRKGQIGKLTKISIIQESKNKKKKTKIQDRKSELVV